MLHDFKRMWEQTLRKKWAKYQDMFKVAADTEQGWDGLKVGQTDIKIHTQSQFQIHANRH